MPLRKSSRRSKRYSTKHCSRGFISRKSYKKKSGTKVKAGCVKSKALRSKGKRATVYFPKLKVGTLSKLGYGVHLKQKSRRKSLKKAIKMYSKNVVIKKLNAVRTLSRNTSPKNAKVYTKDIKFVQKL